MSSPFLAEIKIGGFNFAPHGFAFCDGQLLPISQYTAVFSLLGTYYGGNGQSNFALPNLQNAVPMGQGAGPGLTPRSVGESVGTSSVTLTLSELPGHSHVLNAALLSPPHSAQNTPNPGSTAMLGASNPGQAYSDTTASPAAMASQTLGVAGSSQPHPNEHPILALNFFIALQGIYPARN